MQTPSRYLHSIPGCFSTQLEREPIRHGTACHHGTFSRLHTPAILLPAITISDASCSLPSWMPGTRYLLPGENPHSLTVSASFPGHPLRIIFRGYLQTGRECSRPGLHLAGCMLPSRHTYLTDDAAPFGHTVFAFGTLGAHRSMRAIACE